MVQFNASPFANLLKPFKSLFTGLVKPSLGTQQTPNQNFTPAPNQTLTSPASPFVPPTRPTPLAPVIPTPPVNAPPAPIQSTPSSQTLASVAPPAPVAPVVPTTPVTHFTPISGVEGPGIPRTGPPPGTVITPSGAVVDPAIGSVVTPAPAVPETPVTEEAPEVAPTDLETAQKEFEKNLKLTPEEIKTQEEINRVQEALNKGLIGEADRPIALEFITGRQESLERRALGLVQPLQAKAALLQAKRTASLEASKFRLGIEEGKEANAAKAAEEATKAAAEAAKPVSLPSGSRLVDPSTGNVIVDEVEKIQSISEIYGSGAIGEYNFYAAQEKSAGRTPVSFNEYQDIDANRKRDVGTGANVVLPGATITPDQLSPLAKSIYDGTIGLSDVTPTQRAAIAPELNAVGYSKAVTGEMKENVRFIKDGMGKLMTLWINVPGKFKGIIGGFFGEKLGTKIDPKVASFKAQVGIIGMTLTRMFEKGRISDQDRLFYLSLMPNLGMNQVTAQAGADQLNKVLNDKVTQVSSELKIGKGGEFSGVTSTGLEYTVIP